jgi:transcriptional regulator of NAD metabolism
MQVIQNGLVIENLEKHGDKLEKERQVDHRIYFKSETDRENFIDSIKDNSFEIVEKETTSLGDSPFVFN